MLFLSLKRGICNNRHAVARELVLKSNVSIGVHCPSGAGRDRPSENVHRDNHSLPDLLGSVVPGDPVLVRGLQDGDAVDKPRGDSPRGLCPRLRQPHPLLGAPQGTQKGHRRPALLQLPLLPRLGNGLARSGSGRRPAKAVRWRGGRPPGRWGRALPRHLLGAVSAHAQQRRPGQSRYSRNRRSTSKGLHVSQQKHLRGCPEMILSVRGEGDGCSLFTLIP